MFIDSLPTHHGMGVQVWLAVETKRGELSHWLLRG